MFRHARALMCTHAHGHAVLTGKQDFSYANRVNEGKKSKTVTRQRCVSEALSDYLPEYDSQYAGLRRGLSGTALGGKKRNSSLK